MSRIAAVRLVACLALLAACEARQNADAPASAPAAPPSTSSAPVSASSAVAAGSQLPDEVRAFARSRVRQGYDDRAAIVEATVDFASDIAGSVGFDAPVAKLVDEELDRQRRDEQAWSGPTDCDRLDAAFAALDSAGILARQKFSDCSTCGTAEIREEMAKARAAGRPARGYVFFHDQDVEGAADGGTLYLNYSASTNSDGAAVAVGHEVVAALKKSGLRTDWDGSVERRVGVQLDWKKRRFTKAPL